MEKRFINICPQCGSTNIKSIYLISPAELTIHSSRKIQEMSKIYHIGPIPMGAQPENFSVFICFDCDYNGICPEIEISQIEKFKKELMKKK